VFSAEFFHTLAYFLSLLRPDITAPNTCITLAFFYYRSKCLFRQAVVLLTERRGRALLSCILAVPGSNHGTETAFLTDDFHGFTQFHN
jgi:hypothetical protein